MRDDERVETLGRSRPDRFGVLPGFPVSADLGGLPLIGGGTTTRGRVLRSGVPVGAGIEHLRVAQDAGVVAVVDLRSEQEAFLAPHPLTTLPGYRLLPLVDPAAEVLRDSTLEATLGDLYSRSLERNRRTLRAAVSALADHACDVAAGAAAGGLLVCCSAGRDRTGMVSALLLDLAGVERTAVVEDYRSADGGAPGVDPDDAPAPRRCGGRDIAAMLDHVHTRWGGAAGYLRWLGLPDDRAAHMRSWLCSRGGPAA